MRKLFAIAAVLALCAVPAMAGTPVQTATATGTANVNITVDAYCAVGTIPDLVMTTSDIERPGVDGYALTQFTAQGNKGFTVTLTTPYISTGSGPVYPGQLGGGGYPTAYTGGEPDVNGGSKNGIGFGVTLSNLTTPGAEGVWKPSDGNAKLPFPAGTSTGQIKIQTYIDSGRSASGLADVGVYSTILTLTLAAN